MTDPWLITVLGLASGALAGAAGWGAGLALPLLAWLGTPLTAALLSIKLGFALIDSVAWFAARRARGAAGATARQTVGATGDRHAAMATRRAGLALLGGAAGALSVLAAPSGGELLVPLGGLLVVCLAAASHRTAPTAVERSVCAASLALYIGGCGLGAGLLARRMSRQTARHDGTTCPTCDAVASCALANIGAATALLFAAPLGHGGLDADFVGLAGAQAVGAGLAIAWRLRRPAVVTTALAAPRH